MALGSMYSIQFEAECSMKHVATACSKGTDVIEHSMAFHSATHSSCLGNAKLSLVVPVEWPLRESRIPFSMITLQCANMPAFSRAGCETWHCECCNR